MRRQFGKLLEVQSTKLVDRMADSVTKAAARRFDNYVESKADQVEEPDEADWVPDSGLLDQIESVGLRLPVCFAIIGKPDLNMQLGAAAWRICANLPGQEGFLEDDEPDIVAEDTGDGWVFVGTMSEWETFCEKQDRDHAWTLHGVESVQGETITYEFDELFELPCDEQALLDLLSYSRSANKNVKADLADAQERHDGFHWNEKDNEKTILVVEVPGVSSPMFQMGTVKELQIDDGKIVYDFGEDWPGLFGLKGNVCVIAGRGVKEFLKRHPARGKQVSVPGVSEKCVTLGPGSNVVYKSSKDGEMSLYTHKLGKDAPKSPDAYALAQDAIVIFGGDMVIEDRGIVH